jgi:tRNA pseudouridine38-40 synthase
MTVAYDGHGFHGFSSQPGQETVGGALEDAIARIAGHPVRLTCAGRTDAGVHAYGQVVHADVDLDALCRGLCRGEDPSGWPRRLESACNRMLAPRVAVRGAGLAPEGFDARRSAVSRLYHYQVLNSATPDPFLARTAWHVEEPLDVRAMQTAADAFVGEHDFSAFCRRRGEEQSLVRRVKDACWRVLWELGPADGDSAPSRLLRFEVEAGSFCHQMVRSLAGTMVEVGRGRRSAGDMTYVLRSRDRSLAASPAPPHGLCLVAVDYPPEAAAGGRRA